MSHGSVFDNNTTTSTITAEIDEELRLDDANDSHYVGFKAPAVVLVNTIWTLPNGDGVDGQCQVTNGGSVLRWSNFLQVDTTGPSLRNSVGALHVKTQDGTAFAPIVCSVLSTGDLEMKNKEDSALGWLRLIERPWGLEIRNELTGKKYRVLMEEID